MSLLSYPVRLHPEDGGYVVTFPDVPEAITEGDSRGEALERATDALEAALSTYPERSLPVSAPSSCGSGEECVAVSALASAKLALYSAWRASGISKAELARRAGISRSAVDQVFRFSHRSRLDEIEAVFRALGKQLVLGVEDAA